MDSKLGPVIWYHVAIALESANGANSDNVTLVVLQHFGQKLSQDPEMGQDVDVESLLNMFRGKV